MQVQQPMQQQDADLATQRVALPGGLPGRRVQRNGDVPEIKGGRQAPPRQGRLLGFPVRKREDVGGVCRAAETGIELSQFQIIGQADADLAAASQVALGAH